MDTPSLDLLARGAVTVKGRMPCSSNATFLVQVVLGEALGLAVYKPGRGERPLWDFPPGLFKRELGAWLLVGLTFFCTSRACMKSQVFSAAPPLRTKNI